MRSSPRKWLVGPRARWVRTDNGIFLLKGASAGGVLAGGRKFPRKFPESYTDPRSQISRRLSRNLGQGQGRGVLPGGVGTLVRADAGRLSA